MILQDLRQSMRHSVVLLSYRMLTLNPPAEGKKRRKTQHEACRKKVAFDRSSNLFQSIQFECDSSSEESDTPIQQDSRGQMTTDARDRLIKIATREMRAFCSQKRSEVSPVVYLILTNWPLFCTSNLSFLCNSTFGTNSGSWMVRMTSFYHVQLTDFFQNPQHRKLTR